MTALRFLLLLLLLAPAALLTACPADDDDDSSIGDDDDATGDDDDATGDDDDATGDDDDATGDDDDATGDDDDSTPDPLDADTDGYLPISAGGDDCDDNNSGVNPGAPEDPTNGIDDDCDGAIDEPLSIASLTPDNGIEGGGTTVTISGEGFLTLVSVELGGVTITNPNLIDEETLEINAPGGAVGDADLTVTTQFDTITVTNAFIYTGTASTLDEAILVGPASDTVVLGTASTAFTGTILESGITGTGNAPVGILAEIGYGTQGQLPTTWPDFFWSPATWQSAGSALEDTFSGTVNPHTYGSYVVTFRFSDDGGYNWLYADTNSSTALDSNEMSIINVTP